MIDVDRQEAGVLGYLNLIQFHRESPSWSLGGVVHEETGVLFFATESTFPLMMNGALRTDGNADPDDLVGRADEFFAQRGRGFSLWIREGIDEDLARAAGRFGLVELLRQPEMVCAQRLPVQPLPNDVKIRRVTTVDDVQCFAEINASAYAVYGMRPEAIRQAFSSPERMLLPHVVAAIAYVNGKPAAAAVTLASHGIAGIYWVGTIEAYRKRGLAKAIVREVTNAGFDLGARINTLQASVMGEPVYKSMGYETAFYLRIYLRSRRKG
jgi:predicted GNAT family acetyltransferase